MAMVTLNKVRLAFPNLFEAKSIDDGTPRYGATFIIDPDSKNAKAIEAAMEEVATTKWKAKGEKTLEELKRKEKVAYGEREKTSSAGQVFQGFEDKYFLSSYNKNRPTVIDGRRQPLTANDGKPYAGCYVNAIVDIWAQDDAKFGKRINATLTGVQFHSDGDAFGGGAPAPADSFPDLSDSGDEDDGDVDDLI
jgi:hypothetical protein